MPFSDYKTALVTGASTGMGAAIVERFRREGLEVHALARNAERLKELAERTGCIPHAIDVCDLDAVTKLTSEVEFDILVNNAGVSTKGSILSATESDVDLQIEVNLQAVLHLVRLTMPGMVARDRGHIVNISSIAAIYNFGGNSIYSATKAGIHALSRQLRVDATGKRVRVTEICPGRVATDIFGHVSGNIEAARKEFIDGFELPLPSDIADAIAFAIAAPLAVNISNMEILPTLQVPGGLTTIKREPEAR
ncbi:SDR family oxidoreductase [Caballeronia sp. INDeC2]|uniref:SDR family oxidoreductase n=1 Tax=Caballeronia sp. INDeC2 TaxID=2921747 RepID=UPI00202937B3|nr:SDR family oxidoreductase [Caballeronia sp. INDeC2]